VSALAHAGHGHWADLVYLAPVLAVVGYIAWRAVQERRDPEQRARRLAEGRHEPTLDDVLDGPGTAP
jgi:hypothetical protein